MKRIKNNICMLLLFIFGCQILESQVIYSIVEDTIMQRSYKLNLLPNYKKNIFSYGEGVFITYYYQDSSMVTVFSGALQKLPLLSNDNNYYPCKIDTILNKTTRTGEKDYKFWREDTYQGIIVYYDAVKKEKKYFFDFILDNFIFYKIKR